MPYPKLCTLVFTIALAVPGLAHAQEAPESIVRMTQAAQRYIDALDDEQREIALFAFDDEERENFIPLPFPTEGLRFDHMNDDQIELAYKLMQTGLSAAGYKKASEIIELDDYLVELENQTGRAPRFHGSQNYNVAIFGTPSADGTWAWRMHGHHLYLAFTVVDGRLFATAPAFFGAEPHDVVEGPRAPWRVLADEEDLGSNLMRSLNADQQAAATISDEMPPDMFSGANNRVDPMKPEGIAYTDLTDDQQAQVRALVMEYVNNSPEDLRHERMERVENGGWENIYFGWIGSPERRERNYYRVHGPEFLIEYCATATSPNHVHTVWRDYDGDFGRDILAEHYNQHDH